MTPSETKEVLPKHDEFPIVRRVYSTVFIVAASTLLIVNIFRLHLASDLGVLLTIAITIAGMAMADFLSGVIHWAADTWGRVSMPFFGRRILYPFRVHHVNPADFLNRQFIDTNGDVAIIVTVLLTMILWIPVGYEFGNKMVLFLVAMNGVGLLTNQVHQWSHMKRPPVVVAMLQELRIILSHDMHQQHHTHLHQCNYCISLGWCNPVLERIQFFPKLEDLIERMTGCRPRQDEAEFRAKTE